MRLRAGARLGGGVGDGVSSELMEGCGGGRTRGLGGAESQEEVGEGKLIDDRVCWCWRQLCKGSVECGICLSDVMQKASVKMCHDVSCLSEEVVNLGKRHCRLM